MLTYTLKYVHMPKTQFMACMLCCPVVMLVFFWALISKWLSRLWWSQRAMNLHLALLWSFPSLKA